MGELMNEIHDYWTQRAEGYSDYNKQEMKDDRRTNWKKLLQSSILEAFPGRTPEDIHVLDAGCGPGFFTRLLTEIGFQVTALDCTEEMLREAQVNLGEQAGQVRWMLGDVEKIELPDLSFDCIVSRNVTWNLQHPREAYKEWFRLLQSNGLLLNFDANWYHYLFDEEKKAEYERDRVQSSEAGIDDCNVGNRFEVMEEIARKVPLSRQMRPDWDVKTLREIGYQFVIPDTKIWEQVWSEEEKISCASTPMFMIRAHKDDIKRRVVHYWSARSSSFLDQRREELHHEINERWLREIRKKLPEGQALKILDVGCGAGYFSIILSGEGHQCTGVDLTPEMIRAAHTLAREEGVSCEFKVMDAENLEFEDETFDVVISRNLTWTLPHPQQAYREWLRVLKPKGRLINIDANYGAEDSTRMEDLPTDHAHHMLGNAVLRENNAIKRQLSISFQKRPAWDVGVLEEEGAEELTLDFRISDRVYLEKDQFYNPTRLFLLTADK
ncbi:MAG: methyltransferase domain-containing protein [Lachnospiraceae bacterium]|nr:methyltransferase domain-containing protein [Lachnospiraceae bacterium]